MRAAREAPFAVESDPPRLVQQDDAEGALLTGAQREFSRGLDEAGAWQRFQRAKNASSRWSLTRWWWFAPAFAALAILAMHVRAERELERELVALAPEPVAPVASELPVTASSSENERRNAPGEVPMPTVPRAGIALRAARSSSNLAPAAASIGAPSEAFTDATCRRFSSEGKLEQAVSCFEALGHGAGLSADVALYEAARLSAERLRDPSRALNLLERHAQQFPDSALRGENAWLRVVSLERAGELDAALRESEQLLAGPFGRTLSAKIHLLRGRIYRQNRGDCGHALPEYVALLGEPGASGDEAELGRAACFEQLGQTADAIAAYERYLRRADPRQPARASERLRALRGDPPIPEGAKP